MADTFDDEPRRAPSWQDLQQMIHWWLVARFGLHSTRDKDIWLFCIGAAMELERMAVGVLWVADGRPTPLFEYEAKMTLGQAQQQIEKRGLLDPATRTILRDVAALRNSVAHRHAIFVTAPSPMPGQTVGEYKGYHVFQYREAVDELMGDVDAAAKAMWNWIAEQAPELAEEARHGGFREGAVGDAHEPTPP